MCFRILNLVFLTSIVLCIFFTPLVNLYPFVLTAPKKIDLNLILFLYSCCKHLNKLSIAAFEGPYPDRPHDPFFETLLLI